LSNRYDWRANAPAQKKFEGEKTMSKWTTFLMSTAVTVGLSLPALAQTTPATPQQNKGEKLEHRGAVDQKKGEKLEKKGAAEVKAGEKLENHGAPKAGEKLEKKGVHTEKKGEHLEKKGAHLEKKGEKIENHSQTTK
jgi:hypothetical protein